jgi:transcriptional regulator with XRE-family HTH domain
MKNNLDDKKSIGERLMLFRKEILKTQKDLSEEAGVLQATISQTESGQVFPSFKLIAYLVDTYNLNVRWLINGSGDMMIHLYETGPDTKENQDLRVLMQDAKTDPDLLANMMIRYAELKKIKMIDEASKIPTPPRPSKKKS